MPVDIDPKTGAPIVTGSLLTGDNKNDTNSGPILTIPPVVSTPPPVTSDNTDEGKDNSLVKLTDEEPPVFSSRKEELLYQMNKIIDEANGISNIGMTSNYWELLKEYKSL